VTTAAAVDVTRDNVSEPPLSVRTTLPLFPALVQFARGFGWRCRTTSCGRTRAFTRVAIVGLDAVQTAAGDDGLADDVSGSADAFDGLQLGDLGEQLVTDIELSARGARGGGFSLRVEVDLQGPLPLVEFELEGVLERKYAGVVDQDVDPAVDRIGELSGSWWSCGGIRPKVSGALHIPQSRTIHAADAPHTVGATHAPDTGHATGAADTCQACHALPDGYAQRNQTHW
jgi:hypothetical protein